MIKWWRGVPDKVQSQILRSKARQIICNCHRQWGKSFTIATKGLHYAIYNPGSEILIASATLKQSEEMFKKVSDASKYIDRLETIGNSLTKMLLKNGSRVITLPGTGSSVRSYTAPDLIILDEASWAVEELYAAIRPMMLMSKGQIILISTPHGKQGFFYNVWSHHGEVDPHGNEVVELDDNWERYRVRVTENPRVTKDYIEKERAEFGDRYVEQEYMCKFVETEEQVFPSDLIKSMFAKNVNPLFGDVLSDDIEPMKFGE